MSLKKHSYPSLFQINTRVTLSRLSRALGRHATLDDFPAAEFARLSAAGFDWVWFLGMWQTGPAGRQVSLQNQQWRQEYRELLPDFQEDDVCGSCFAIQQYTAHADFGGDAAVQRLRDRVHDHGMHLLLDFVPNHTAPDHPWVKEHPEYFVHGTEDQLAGAPQNYRRVEPHNGTILAYGRDPYFDGWPDTFQLNYADSGLQEAMKGELERIASLCDGVRCDMAMLILPDVFERTWGLRPEPFWPNAIQRARAVNPDFLFMAEVYWDLEWTLQQQGFNYTYDKRLYDRLRDGHAGPVRDHFLADMDFQRRSARFLENHDEPRAASVFETEKHMAAAILTFLCPGLRFIHQGQQEGFTKHIPVHLGRGPSETLNPQLEAFYVRLQECMRQEPFRTGEWSLLNVESAWEGNWTEGCFVCFAWRRGMGLPLIVAVNFAPNQSQGYLKLRMETVSKRVRLKDLMGPESYDRSVDELNTQGLYLDLPGWGFNVFELEALS